MERKLQRFLAAALTCFALFSCSEDETDLPADIQQDPFVVAFETLSANLTQIETTQDISLVYSQTAEESGSITITVTSNIASYGTDFTTQPEAVNGIITLPINSGQSSNGLVFNKINQSLDESVEISFTITQIDYPNANIQGNDQYLISNSPSLGRGVMPEVGGPNQPNQVYIDLSTETEINVRRDSWDLGFYSQDDFRVGINGSIYMAAKELEFTNIDEVREADVQDILEEVAIGTFDPINENYIDHPDGDILKTAFNEVSSDNSQNKVYLVNLGFEVGTETPEPGSVAVAGDPRGWKKVRVLRQDDGYLFQHANLNQTTHEEVFIPKSNEFNFTFFSFNTNSIVSVEPKAQNWDVTFTVFTNIIEGSGSYGFSDGVLHNRKGNVKAYEVLTDQFAYNDFSPANVDNSKFLSDQRAIGSNWRDVFDDIALEDRFYVLQDPNGNIYKIRFLALVNDNGERGFPEFQYELVQ